MSKTEYTIPRVVLSFKALIHNKSRKILLLERSPKSENFPKLWELPGGKMDISEDINLCLAREIKEETGLAVKPAKNPFYIEKHISILPKYKGLPYMMLVFKSKLLKGKVKINHEHTDYRWVLFEDAFKLRLMSETKRALLSLTHSR